MLGVRVRVRADIRLFQPRVTEASGSREHEAPLQDTHGMPCNGGGGGGSRCLLSLASQGQRGSQCGQWDGPTAYWGGPYHP